MKNQTGTAKFPVIEINTWQDYLKTASGSRYKNWAFRGQSNAEWPIYSSLSRYLRNFGIHQQAWARQEDRILRIFERKAHLYLEHVPVEEDNFQWLALMQHHGAPTRLIDFTWSPFVAAFFALEHATKDAAVWAISPSQLWNTTHKFPGRKTAVKTDELNMRIPGNYKDFFLGNNVPFVVYGEPVIMNKRLIAQSGTFVVPGTLDRPVENILSSPTYRVDTVVKFILKTDLIRDEAMQSLYNMNLTNATLFPDLDGLARSMAFELEFHWAFNPKTMENYPGY